MLHQKGKSWCGIRKVLKKEETRFTFRKGQKKAIGFSRGGGRKKDYFLGTRKSDR